MARRVIHGDMLQELPKLAADGERFHSVVTDPPYHLTSGNAAIDWAAMGPNGTKRPNIGPTNGRGRGFMGKQWDGGDVAFRPETWRAVFDVMLPGAYLVAFGGTRTWHRMVCAIEDAGFVIHPMLAWIFASGFPKATRLQCEGTEGLRYGLQALKPAIEPICMAQKPMQGTGTQNWLAHGTGAINVDACRVPTPGGSPSAAMRASGRVPASCRPGEYGDGHAIQNRITPERWIEVRPGEALGRYPANLLHDGSDEVEAAFAAFGNSESSSHTRHNQVSLGSSSGGIYGTASGFNGNGIADTGSASRFFYCAKADRGDRADSRHPTVKPVALLRWLVRLVCPPGGRILDPFAGSGTTGEAAMLEGFDAVLIERDEQHAADIRHRIKRWSGLDAPLFAEVAD
jgi:site-specific DNA-methyltransferase (adenine-specific)